MIVLEDRELVVMTPPHTASGNLHRALCAPSMGGFWAIGQTPDGKGYDHHVTQVSEGWRDFRVAVVVRHPLDRLIGLYEHHQESAKLNGWQPIAWWEFVAIVLSRHPDLSWFYRTTISELIGDQVPDVILRYESLAADLEQLFGNVVLPSGWTEQRDWSAYYAQIGPCCQAEWWGRSDMERFGYRSKMETIDCERFGYV